MLAFYLKQHKIESISMKYVIKGLPVPLLRARHTRYSVYDSQKQLRIHQELELSHQVKHKPYEKTPLLLTAIFYFTPPPKMPLKQKKALIGTAHIIRPDTSNVNKWIEDISQGAGLFTNDCAIAFGQQLKIYDWEARTEFTVKPLTQENLTSIAQRLKEEIES